MNYHSRRYVVAAVLLGVWILSVFLTWRIVENPFYDFADWLFSAERWAAGNIIYKDFQTPYPPLAFWLFGFVIKLIPNSYAAITIVSALFALLFLVACYKIARLLHNQWNSLMIAICAYLATNILLSAGGSNLIIARGVYIGLPLYAWFVWFVAQCLLPNRSKWVNSICAGLLGGLCLLTKHEWFGGVLTVVCFLIIYRYLLFRKMPHSLNITSFLIALFMVGLGGYGFSVLESGWFYVSQSLTNYGMISNSAAQNMPSLAHVQIQLILLLLHTGVFLIVVGFATRSRLARPGFHLANRLFGISVVMIILGLLLLGIEIWRVSVIARNMDLNSVNQISQTMVVLGLLSPQNGDLQQAMINYAGSIFFYHIIPTSLVMTGIGLFLFIVFLRKKYISRKAIPIRFVWISLLLFAVISIQARYLFQRSDYSVPCLVFPMFFFIVPRFAFQILRLKPMHTILQAIQRRYIGIFLAGILLAGGLLYVYEFRDARIHPIKVKTDKGTVFMPDLPEHRAFADLIKFMREKDFNEERIVVVPFSGPQYWIGGEITPFAWGAYIQPESYHPPWTSNLNHALQKNEFVFIEFLRSEVSVQYHIITKDEYSWIDGPKYRIDRWKENFPELWDHIRTNTKKIAWFGPEDNPYFCVWSTEYKPKKSAKNPE